MGKKYTRPLSSNERLLLVADMMCPPVVNQLFFEGKGIPVISQWQHAVAAASEANPGSRSVLRGSLRWSRWIDSGITPPLIEISDSQWNGNGPEGAPFLQRPLDPFQGPSCEILIIHGELERIVFRTHHAVMDGRGTMTWMEDIFRVLNGMKPMGSSDSTTDAQMARRYQKLKRKAYPGEHIVPGGKAQGDEDGVTWKRARIKGKAQHILARTALLVAREAWKHNEGVVRLGIPVDMRQHDPSLRSTGNLSYSLIIEIKADSTVESVSSEISSQMERFEHCKLYSGDEIYRFIPLSIMKSQGAKILQQRHESGFYNITGYLSNMGRIPLKYFQGGGFKAETICGIPPSILNIPFFLGMGGYDDTLELVLTMPKVLASEGRIEEVLGSIASQLASGTDMAAGE